MSLQKVGAKGVAFTSSRGRHESDVHVAPFMVGLKRQQLDDQPQTVRLMCAADLLNRFFTY